MHEEKQLLIEHGILDAIEKDARVTQSELARNLSISLGLCNAYLKRLINKGYVKAANFKLKNARYFLTPDGIALKIHLTKNYMLRSLDYYRILKNRCEEIVTQLKLSEARTVAFIGDEEVFEILFLYLCSTKIELLGVFVDRDIADLSQKTLFKHQVQNIKTLKDFTLKHSVDKFIISNTTASISVSQELLNIGSYSDNIINIF